MFVWWKTDPVPSSMPIIQSKWDEFYDLVQELYDGTKTRQPEKSIHLFLNGPPLAILGGEEAKRNQLSTQLTLLIEQLRWNMAGMPASYRLKDAMATQFIWNSKRHVKTFHTADVWWRYSSSQMDWVKFSAHVTHRISSATTETYFCWRLERLKGEP
jgi:hypothetical protein